MRGDRDPPVRRDRPGERRGLPAFVEVRSVLGRDRVLFERPLPSELSDLLGDIERHGKVLSGPPRLASDLLNGLDEQLALPVLHDLPGAPVQEEDLLGLGQDLGQDEPLVQRPDEPPGADVAEAVRSLVRDEGERGVEPVQGPAARRHAVTEPFREAEPDQVIDELVPFGVGDVRRGRGVLQGSEELGELEAALGTERCDHLLRRREPVAGAPGDRLQQSGVGPPSEHRRLLEVVVVQREDGPMDRPVEPVARTADALNESTDLMRGAELDDVVDDPDVDPELEGRGRDQRPELSIPERALGLLPDLSGERAVVDRDREVRRELLQTGRKTLGRGAGIDEDQRGPMLPDLLFDRPQAVKERRVGLELAHERFVERRPLSAGPACGELERPPLLSDPDLYRTRGGGKEPGDLGRVPDGRREADTDGPSVR